MILFQDQTKMHQRLQSVSGSYSRFHSLAFLVDIVTVIVNTIGTVAFIPLSPLLRLTLQELSVQLSL